MQWLFGVDWKTALFPETPLLEIVVRGTVMYLSLFLLLRFILKREYGALGITDLLVVVLIADASQNGMSGGYRSITDGLLLVLVILGWAYALDRLSFRFPLIARIVTPPPLPLVKEGRMLRGNMRKELVTEAELMSRIREQGIDDLAKVRLAMMEPDGSISVISEESQPTASAPERRRV